MPVISCGVFCVLFCFLLQQHMITGGNESMERYCEREGNCLRIKVPKELDHHEAGRLKLEADMMIDAYHVKTLIFDFGETEFMDSSGIGVLIGRSKKMGYYGGEVYAQHLNGRVQKIFRVSGLHALIQTDMPDKE